MYRSEFIISKAGKAFVSKLDDMMSSPLHEAARQGFLDMGELLLEYGEPILFARDPVLLHPPCTL